MTNGNDNQPAHGLPAAAGGGAGPGGGAGAGGNGGPPANPVTTMLTGTNWSLVILLIFAGSILAAVLLDNPVLRRLQDPAYARGVITFLVALAAIALAFMFAYQAFAGPDNDDAFRRGREVLAGLMGVLGTIVGFYFGSTDSGGAALEVALMQNPGFMVAHAIGGTAPYRGSMKFEPNTVTAIDKLQSEDGWFTIPLAQAQGATKTTLEVTDAKGIRGSKTIELTGAGKPLTPAGGAGTGAGAGGGTGPVGTPTQQGPGTSPVQQTPGNAPTTGR